MGRGCAQGRLVSRQPGFLRGARCSGCRLAARHISIERLGEREVRVTTDSSPARAPACDATRAACGKNRQPARENQIMLSIIQGGAHVAPWAAREQWQIAPSPSKRETKWHGMPRGHLLPRGPQQSTQRIRDNHESIFGMQSRAPKSQHIKQARHSGNPMRRRGCRKPHSTLATRRVQRPWT